MRHVRKASLTSLYVRWENEIEKTAKDLTIVRGELVDLIPNSRNRLLRSGTLKGSSLSLRRRFESVERIALPARRGSGAWSPEPEAASRPKISKERVDLLKSSIGLLIVFQEDNLHKAIREALNEWTTQVRQRTSSASLFTELAWDIVSL
jgi:hypothetical protein